MYVCTTRTIKLTVTIFETSQINVHILYIYCMYVRMYVCTRSDCCVKTLNSEKDRVTTSFCWVRLPPLDLLTYAGRIRT